MKWHGLRWDRTGIRPGHSLSLHDGTQCDVPLVASGEHLLRDGVEFRIHGLGVAQQTAGSYLCSQTKTEVDSMLDTAAAAGINLVSVMGFDQPYGAVASGDLTGRPASCWTTTGATAYWDEFWSGSGEWAGFDYFVDACRRRGIYMALRWHVWQSVFTGVNGLSVPESSSNDAFQGLWHCDGSNGTPDLNQMMKDHVAVFLNHVNTVNGIRLGDDYTLAIFNTFNERGYHPFYYGTTGTTNPDAGTFDEMVDAGGTRNAMYVHDLDARYVAWHTAAYGAGPTWNGVSVTALPCFAFSDPPGASINARPGPNEPFRVHWTTNSAGTATQYTERQRVAEFWEWLCDAFHADFKAYVKSLAPHVLYSSAQGTYHLHADMEQSDILDTHCYQYPSNTVQANGNYQLDTAVTLAWAAGTLTVTAVAPNSTHALVVGQPIRVVADATYGSLGVTTFMWKPGRAFSVNSFCVTSDNRVYKCTTGGTTSTTSAGPTGTGTGIADGSCVWSRIWSEVVTIATVLSSTSFDGASTDPGTVSGMVVMPGLGSNQCLLHVNPATDGADTIVPANLLGTVQDVVLADGFNGDATGLGNIYNAVFRIGNTLADRPRYSSEMGMQGLSVTAHVQHPLLYTIYDLLQGGNGWTWFALINGAPIQYPGDHTLQSHGTTLLMMELITLINRYGAIPALSGLDETVVSMSDIYQHCAYRTTAPFPDGGYTGGLGFSKLVSTLELAGEDGQWGGFVHERLRYSIGASAKTNVTHGLPTAAGGTLNGMTDANVCRMYMSRNTGYLTVETPYLSLAVGRIPGGGLGPGSTSSTALTRMSIERPKDTTKHWYGAVAWVSDNGVALGAAGGSSRVYSMMYPRTEDQQFAAIRRNSSSDSHCATLDGGYGEYTPASAILPGYVLPEDMRLKLVMATTSPAAYVSERDARRRRHPAFHASGNLIIYPSQGRVLIR